MRKLFADLLPRMWTNWITLSGSAVATVSGVAILVLFGAEIAGGERSNVYANSFLLLILPFVFAFGLLLIPIGLLVDRRHKRKAGLEPGSHDPIQAAFSNAMRDRKARRRVIFVIFVTCVNIFLFAFAGHKSVAYMDSPKFCGTTCHTVMQPEWEAYNRSPHSRVACVQCHIGPGASWAVKSKINGISQVWKVATKSYHSPVPTPVEHLRPSRDTCEQCHWPDKFAGSKLKLFPHYKADEKNTPIFNAVLLHVGGENPRTKRFEGIHWHVSSNNEVHYEYLDRERTKIGKITVHRKGEPDRVYTMPGQKEKALGERLMDCVDCHNRPTHITDITPHDAVDRALYAGELDLKVPYMAKVSIELLARPDITRDRAQEQFRAALAAEYAKLPSAKVDDAKLDKAAATLAEIFRHNVYPQMHVGWNTYRTNLGHRTEGLENPGCYRCHDKTHETTLADGTKKTLSQDCDSCHERLAFEEDPAKLEDALQAMLPKGGD